MRDKKAVVFPTTLFGTFFVLVTITGILQVKIIGNNLDDLLRNQGGILFNHIKREIDVNLEYLDLLDKSASIITPSLLNILAYDEAIVEDFYTMITETTADTLASVPLEHILVFDERGRMLARKGAPRIPTKVVQLLVSKSQETYIKMPTTKDQTLLVGARSQGNIIIAAVEGNELEAWRKKYIVRGIIENEGKRFDVVGIKIYGPEGTLYASTGEQKEHTFPFARILDSKFLPRYRMEVFLSRAVADDIFRQTISTFGVILFLLLLLGAVSTYVTFLLARKYDKKVKEMERDMEVKERLVSLGKLASGMAHEIRNPLNAISMSIQRLKREFSPQEEKRDEYGKFLDIMRRELGRVDRIVEDFLLSTKSSVPFSSENLHDLVEDVLVILREKAASRNVSLANNTQKDIRIMCQAERIKQAFYNIILNGMEAITGQGVVEVSSVQKGSDIHISITDNGSGISEDHMRSIFEYYYTTKDKGMGLGLPISYMIVKDHGGDIQVVSEKGKGSRFVIRIPMAPTNVESMMRSRP